MKRELIDYFYRVVARSSNGDKTTVAFFLLREDAIEWAIKENEIAVGATYSVIEPKKPAKKGM